MQVSGKKITTVVSDLDGTLLKDRDLLDSKTHSLIREMKNRGISFVAASGRQYDNMRILFEPVLSDVSFICENGSMIIKDGEIIYAKYMPRELALELAEDLALVEGTNTIASSERKLYVLSSQRKFGKMLGDRLYQKIEYVDDYRDVPGSINKMSIWWKEGIPQKEEAWFHQKYDGRLQVVNSGDGWFDFTVEGADKGKALLELSRLQGFLPEEVLCFGDSENDVSMFRVSGVSVAMEEAMEHVKTEADIICKNVEEILEQFLQL